MPPSAVSIDGTHGELAPVSTPWSGPNPQVDGMISADRTVHGDNMRGCAATCKTLQANVGRTFEIVAAQVLCRLCMRSSQQYLGAPSEWQRAFGILEQHLPARSQAGRQEMNSGEAVRPARRRGRSSQISRSIIGRLVGQGAVALPTCA